MLDKGSALYKRCLENKITAISFFFGIKLQEISSFKDTQLIWLNIFSFYLKVNWKTNTSSAGLVPKCQPVPRLIGINPITPPKYHRIMAGTQRSHHLLPSRVPISRKLDRKQSSQDLIEIGCGHLK